MNVDNIKVAMTCRFYPTAFIPGLMRLQVFVMASSVLQTR